ncbi:TPA: hypothetical protein QEM49_000266 [Pseudomonas putida]|uniref:hypothetical protein n=1 Tax=Pseudomonas putida TaxID=303 RepID=UPI0023644D7E|nr:hypothetical protein [Pseudomonas putida]MDD2008339.1 hypothetical protein [Pseudomonas putida]HDS1775805.1 hypothetical protein [Pseudomonas putida]
MRKFKLKYLHDCDEMNPTHHETDRPIKVGDAIELVDGFWYGVRRSVLASADLRRRRNGSFPMFSYQGDCLTMIS